jgi:hypothetical protein
MTYEQKLNAISRTIILLTFICLLFSKTITTILVGIITLFSVYVLYFFHVKEKNKFESKKETFENQATVFLKENKLPRNPNIFMKPTSKNPFSNVLMTDYDFNPHKKPAPPAFNSNVNETILSEAKKLVGEINKDQPDITNKLFKDLGEKLEFEQSMRQYISNPSTKIPNDSTSFAEFCYGSIISAKEGNLFAAAKNLPRYNLY